MPRKPEPKGPRPPLPGLMEIVINWTSHVIPQTFNGNSILHARWSDNVNHSVADNDAILTHLESSGVGLSYLVHSISSDVAITGYSLRSKGGDGFQADESFTIQGSGAAGALPPQCAVCITWKSTASWRGGKPRTYLPGIPSSARGSAAGAGLLSSFTTSVKNDANNWIADLALITGSGAHLIAGFPSYFSNYAFRPVPLFFPFTQAVVHDRIDSQRRRSGKERAFGIN